MFKRNRMFRGIYLAMGLLIGSIAGAAQAADVTIKMVNPEGEDLPSNIAVGWPYDKFPSPYTKTGLTLPATLNIRADFAGVYGSSFNFGNTTWNIPAREGKIVRWDVLASALVDSMASDDGSSQIHLVYSRAVRPVFGVIDLANQDVPGGQILVALWNRTETHEAPFFPGWMRLGGMINLRAKLPNGNETPAAWTVTIKKDTRETINAPSLSVVTESPYEGSRFDFQYGIFSVPVQTVDGSGTPIAGEIKIGSGGFEPSPVLMVNQVPGTQIMVQGLALGVTTPTAGVRLHPDSTFTIATNGGVIASYTPGEPKVNVRYEQVSYEVVVTDLDGNAIIGLDGETVLGQVLVDGASGGWVGSGFTGSVLNGSSLNMRGRFDDLETATKTVQALKDHTVIISANDGFQNPPVSTPGQTRIEFRYEPLELNASVVGALGLDLENATVRLVNITDQNGTPHAVPVPYKALIRGGRLINVEVYYNGVEAYQFNMQTQGGVVRVYDQSGQYTGTQATAISKTGFEAQIDDAPVTIRTVNSAGQAVDGQVQISGGAYEDAPVTKGVLNGKALSVRGQFNGFEMLSSVGVTVQRGYTQEIDAITRQVAAIETPDATEIRVVFASVDVEIAVTDLAGNPIVDLDGTTLRGHVLVNNVTADWVLSSHSMLATQGQNLGVRGRFDDLETATKVVQVLKDHTVIISANDGVQNPPVSTPGQTRIEFRYEPLELNASVIGTLGFDLENATVRLVNITDQNGTPHAVPVPHKVLIRGGRLINVEVYYNGVEAYQFNMETVGGVVRVYDQSGQFTGTKSTDSNKTGFEAQIDDAPVTILTVDGSGEPVSGHIRIGTGDYQASPASLALKNGQVLAIQGKYNNFEMFSSVSVSVHRDSTKSINALTRQVTSVYTPDVTAIHVVFSTAMVEVAITDLAGNPIVDAQGQAYGQVQINGVTTDWEPSGFEHYANAGQTLGVSGRFDNLESGFHAIPVLANHRVTINPVTGVVSDPAQADLAGKMRIEFRYDPVVFTAQVVNEHGENLESATLRLVGVTDPQAGTPGFVATPFTALMQNGRDLNMQVRYGLYAPPSLGLPKVVGGSVLLFDKTTPAGSETVAAGTGGARIVIDDASVTVKTVYGETEVFGNVNVKLYTTLFEQSPIHIPHIINGTVLEIAANYNGVNMNAVLAPVVENHTVMINALTREVSQPVSSPNGETLILVNFNPNRPPVADAGPDQTVEATGILTPVTLDGSGSSDPDGDDLTYNWTWDGGSAVGVSPQIALPLGDTEITLTVSDGKLEDSDAVIISVVDTTPPVVAVDSPNDGALLTKPSVTVTAPGSGSTVNSSSLTVTGTATDDGSGVASVFVNGVEATRDGDAFEAALSDLPDGPLTIIATARDNAGNESSASIKITIDTTPPVILELTESVVVEATGPDGETVTLSVVAEDALTKAEDLTYYWFAGDNLLGQTASIDVFVAGLGDYTFKVVVADAAGNEVEGLALVTVQDTTPPVLTLVGGDVNLELGTTFVEPGFSAIDLVNGDLTEAVVVGNPVDVLTEGSYTITYEVSDASGNVATATRQVNVVVTANSYVVVATNSVALQQNAKVYTGFVGMVNYGSAPFLGDREFEMKQNAETMAGVQVRSPRAKLNQNARVHGKLITSEANILRNARVNELEQVGGDYWPLFQGIGLPEFQTGTPGSQNINIKQNTKNAAIDAGAYNKIVIRQNTTVKFTGGEYHIHTLDIQQNANVVFEAPTTLLIADRFILGQNSKFEPGSGLGASDMLVYVAGENNYKGKKVNLTSDPPVRIRQNSRVSANIYAPNGTLLIETNSVVTGSLIGKDVGLEQNVRAYLESGWNMPGVIYNPGVPALAKPVLAKPVVEAEVEEAPVYVFGLDQNFPNPFNPSTTIRYTLGEASDVRLVIYNVLGQEVRMLVDAAQTAGLHNVVWDGRDALGRHVASGMYIYHLQAGQNVAIRKLLFAK